MPTPPSDPITALFEAHAEIDRRLARAAEGILRFDLLTTTGLAARMGVTEKVLEGWEQLYPEFRAVLQSRLELFRKDGARFGPHVVRRRRMRARRWGGFS